MSIGVYAGISLRRADNIGFGTVVRMGRGRLGITTDAVFRVGDFVEFQLELTGWDRAVSGVAEVAKVDLRAPRSNRFLMRVLEMRRTDRDQLQEWYMEQRAAAELEDSHGALDSQVGSRAPSRIGRELPRAGAGEEAPRSTWGVDPALSISQTVEHQGSRRQALRAVLRAAFSEPAQDEREVVTPHAADPAPRIMLELDPARVALHYRSLEAWRKDWEAWLRQGLAFVRYEGPSPQLDQQLSMRLVLPNQLDMRCPAKVVVLHPTGFGVELDIDPHQHEGMRNIGLTEEEHPAMSVARGVAVKAREAANTPIDRTLWLRLFGLNQDLDPLEAALAELPDPLEPLHMDRASDRRRLDQILERADEDYLVLCDEVTDLLRDAPWRWPELEDHCRHSRDPMSQAAAYVVLSHITRVEAVQTLRKAANQALDEPALVEVGPSSKSATCPRCKLYHGDPTTPAALARRGLPPFHLGCQCRVVHRIDHAAQI
jgi:hypothetical protein